jgi:tetratricopeptide (TPR) repeat protein
MPDLIEFAIQHYGPDGLLLAITVFLLWYRFKPAGYTVRERFVRSNFGYLLSALIMFAIGYHGWKYRFWGIPSSFSHGEIGILVAEVPNDQERQKQDAYAQAIRALAESSPDLKDVISARLIQRPLSKDPERQQAEALRIGRWTHATFVLRPFQIAGVQEPWLTVVDQPEFSRVESPEGKIDNAELANLASLRLPSDVVSLSRCVLALADYNRGDYNQSIAELKQVLTASNLPDAAPSRADLEFYLGTGFSDIKDNKEAELALRTAVRLGPDLAYAHLNLGVTLIAENDYSGAEKELAFVNRQSPFYSFALSDLCGIHAVEGKALLAIDECREAISLDKKSVQPYDNLCVAMINNGDYSQAADQCDIASQLSPKDPIPLVDKATLLDLEKRYDESIREVKAAMKLRPDWAGSYAVLGKTLLDKGDIDGALEAFKQAVKLEPTSAAYHQGLGGAFERQHDLHSAEEEYRKSISLDAKDGISHNNLCSVLNQMGEFGPALIECKEAESLGLNVSKLYFNFGVAYLREKHYTSAAAEFNKALNLDPNYAEAHSNLCATLALMRDFDEAMRECQAAIFLNPQLADAHSNACYLCIKKKEFQEAVDECENALKLAPLSVDARQNLAFALREISSQRKQQQNRKPANSRQKP